MAENLVWFGIVFCLTQSAMFSGLNLAFFGLSRLQLEVEAETSQKASRVLAMRQDSNFLLTTILWGNVGINVLLTLLSNSVMAGVSAFLFSTVAITFLGEIFPQAYFSRNALRMASLLGPVLRVYQFILYPVAKPSALLLDAWLGKESAEFFREKVIKDILLRHVEHDDSEVNALEGIGALNFLEIDGVAAVEEGTPVDATSIVVLETDVDLPRVPDFEPTLADPFLQQVHQSGRKWVILAGQNNEPLLLLDADGFLRAALLSGEKDAYPYCHRPIMVTSDKTKLGYVIKMMRNSKKDQFGVIENDAVLIWTDKQQRIITGADLFDRLLQGIK